MNILKHVDFKQTTNMMCWAGLEWVVQLFQTDLRTLIRN